MCLLECRLCPQVPDTAETTNAGPKGVVKVKSNAFGSYVDVCKIRSNPVIEVCWVCRIVKQGRNYEVAPMRPVAVLRSNLSLTKNEVVQLA